MKRFFLALAFLLVLLCYVPTTQAQGLWSHPDTIWNHLSQSHGGVPPGMSEYELEVYHSQLHVAERNKQAQYTRTTRTKVTVRARIAPRRWFRKQ